MFWKIRSIGVYQIVSLRFDYFGQLLSIGAEIGSDNKGISNRVMRHFAFAQSMQSYIVNIYQKEIIFKNRSG